MASLANPSVSESTHPKQKLPPRDVRCPEGLCVGECGKTCIRGRPTYVSQVPPARITPRFPSLLIQTTVCRMQPLPVEDRRFVPRGINIPGLKAIDGDARLPMESSDEGNVLISNATITLHPGVDGTMTKLHIPDGVVFSNVRGTWLQLTCRGHDQDIRTSV